MTTFLDGPAAGVALTIRRTPRLLRVVRSWTGRWDALDQLGDEPKPWEEITVYRLVGVTGIACRRSGRGRGCFPMATYRVVEPQPAADQVRDTAAWREWALKEDRR